MSTPEEAHSRSPDAEATGLPDWCNVYADMTDEEIAELEKIILDRSNFMRPWQDDGE